MQLPPCGPEATNVCIILLINNCASGDVSVDPSAPIEASATPLANPSTKPSPNFLKLASYSLCLSSASFIASNSSCLLFSNFASSTANLLSLSRCFRILPNAHCKLLSHRSIKSTSIPVLRRERIKSAPAASCISSFFISSALFHNFPAEHGRRLVSPQCVISCGTT